MRLYEIEQEIKRWEPLASEPSRMPMSRGVLFPTAAAEMLSLKQEVARTRVALGEAIALLRLLGRQAEDSHEGRELG